MPPRCSRSPSPGRAGRGGGVRPRPYSQREMSSQQVSILRQLDATSIQQLRARSEFFWADLALDDGVSPANIARELGLSATAAQRLAVFAPGGSPARKIHVESELIVFPFWCTDPPSESASPRSEKLALFRVNVLVHGDFLLTVHERRIDLPELVAEGGIPADRSERYVVYVVLDGMTSALLERLAAMEGEIGDLETQLWEAGLRPGSEDEAQIRRLRSDLTTLRLGVGPERGVFERVSEEIEHVSGLPADPQQYFERVLTLLDRAVDRIDAASGALSNALQVKLNETTYRLTVVATIFLPLTFITGFFGMNFGWMVGNVESAAAFWLLGVGSVAALLLALVVLGLSGRAGGGLRRGGSA
jgi:magnesium transporter